MVLLWLNEDEPFPQPPRTIDWTIDFDLLDTVPDPQSPEDEQLWNLSGPSVGPPAPTLIADASCRLDNVQFGPDKSFPANAISTTFQRQRLVEVQFEPVNPSLTGLRGYNQLATHSTVPSPVPPLTERTYSQGSSGLLSSVIAPTPPATETRDPPNGLQKRKKGPYDAEGREHAKIMRREGACLRCRICRMKCDQGSPCSNCDRIRHSARLYNQPCVRFNLRDLLPFRAGNSRTGDVRSKFQKYAWSQDYPDVREIYVGHDLDGPLLRIRCKRFVPGAGDYLSESFESEDGEAKEVIEFPPFACIDADSEPMRRAMSRYLDDSIRRANKAIDSEITDELVFLTLDEARRYVRMRAGCPSETSTIVASALKILAASYVSEDQPAIIHGDTLGIPLVDNRKLKQHNQRLIPISLDYQIDNLYIAYMKRHLDHVGPGLKQLIYKAKKNERKETWYEIFLTTFVLLLNLELVLDKQTRFVRKYKETNANAFVFATKTQMAMIEEWRASAKNLIYHYRCVVRGMDPFGQEWTREMQKEAKLDDESLAIVQKLSQIIAMRRDELNGLAEKDLDNDEATPLLWVTRLFAQDLVLIFSSPVTDCINSTTPLKLGRPSTRARNRCRPALEHFPRRNAHKCFAH